LIGSLYYKGGVIIPTRVEVKSVEFIDRGWPEKVDKSIISSNQRLMEGIKRMDEFEKILTEFVLEMRQSIQDLRDQVELLKSTTATNTDVGNLGLKISEISERIEVSEEKQLSLWNEHKIEHEASKGIMKRIFGK